MTFADWARYFRANHAHLADLSWDDPYQLTQREKRAAGRSLQHFQRFETSEGQQLQRRAAALPDPEYAAAIRGLISEEGDHSLALGRFLDQQGLPRLRRSWVNTAFRGLRRWGSLETTVRVLLTAEVVGTVYFRALYHASFSGLLQQLSLRIIRDEQMHVNFQCFTLTQLRPRASRLGWGLRQLLHGGLTAGTALVVWLCFNRTLWAGGMGPVGFFAAVAEEWDRACALLRHPETICINPPRTPQRPVAERAA
ncbi:hypothetical protein LJ737_08115 [Hymenobacter sp. 15J16-1T3B]|uniref:hypothetical protein n=1 Tax=Hymenobacter sp. 15J16-1T3B TaxID=2886941 RepID=UPI001D117E59|nr:hypothetical protein [Hymenobacter sp. 15J16-1T3B]MCC3157199.1 hypothetical protein [Hymenobacter sp. 15J16-1T3B]